MKKRAVLTLLAALGAKSLYALPFANPYEVSLYTDSVWRCVCGCDRCCPVYPWWCALSIRAGFYGDYVFNRLLQTESFDSPQGFFPGESIDRGRLFTNAGYLALNLADRVDAFGTAGYTSISVKSNSARFSPTLVDTQVDLDFDTEFSWSVGGRGTIWEWCAFAIGVEGQYFQTKPRLHRFRREDTGTSLTFHNLKRSRYWEWQIGMGISYDIRPVCWFAATPYVGGKWAHCKLELNDFRFIDPEDDELFEFGNLEQRALWGYAAGVSFTIRDSIGATIEYRWEDERALYFNAQFRF